MTDEVPKVVIDTNVVISAAISIEGNPARIFEMLLLEEIKNYTSEDILSEVREVFERDRLKQIINSSDSEFIIENFENFSERANPSIMHSNVKDDPADNKFLDCAVEAKVDYIISGDEHLLLLKEFKDIKIISPAAFIKIFDVEKVY
jgi:uncharacterized protein